MHSFVFSRSDDHDWQLWNCPFQAFSRYLRHKCEVNVAGMWTPHQPSIRPGKTWWKKQSWMPRYPDYMQSSPNFQSSPISVEFFCLCDGSMLSFVFFSLKKDCHFPLNHNCIWPINSPPKMATWRTSFVGPSIVFTCQSCLCKSLSPPPSPFINQVFNEIIGYCDAEVGGGRADGQESGRSCGRAGVNFWFPLNNFSLL